MQLFSLLHSKHERVVDEGVASGLLLLLVLVLVLLFGVHLNGEKDYESVQELEMDVVGVVSVVGGKFDEINN